MARDEWANPESPPPSPPEPTRNKRKLISVLKGTFVIWRRTKVWLTEQCLCINERPGAPQQEKVLVTGLCIFQTDNREFLQKGEGSGRTKKLAHEPPAIPSHRWTRRWRKWTRQGGGWWRESSLGSLHFKSLQEKSQRAETKAGDGDRSLLKSEKKFMGGGGEKKNPKQTNLI